MAAAARRAPAPSASPVAGSTGGGRIRDRAACADPRAARSSRASLPRRQARNCWERAVHLGAGAASRRCSRARHAEQRRCMQCRARLEHRAIDSNDSMQPAGRAGAHHTCRFSTSRSKDRSASARPRSPSGSPRGSTRSTSSRKRRIRSSRTSTPAVRARRCRRSSSTCSTGTGSSCRSGRAICSRRSTVCDYLFDKDKIFAYLNLDDNELFIYQRLYDLLVEGRAGAGSRRSTCRRRPTCSRAGCAIARARPSGESLEPEPRVPARAERGLPALLLSLLRDAAARRGDLAVRSGRQRRGPRRSDPPDQRHEPGHAVLRAADVAVES